MSMNKWWPGCVSALGVLKQLEIFVLIWNWLLSTRPSLKHSGAWKSLLYTFLCTKQGCPPFLAKQFHPPPPKKPHNHLAHIFLCTRVVLGLARKKERETERVCVCKVSTHSQEIISDKKNSQGKTNITWYHLLVTSKKMNLFTKQIHREWTYGYPVGWWVWAGIDCHFGFDIYTRLYLKWMTNKDVVDSTGNSA